MSLFGSKGSGLIGHPPAAGVWGDETEIAAAAVALAGRRISKPSDPKTTARPASELLADAGHEVVTEPGQSTLVSWRASGDAPAAADALAAAGVVVRDLPGTGLLREPRLVRRPHALTICS